MKPPAAGEPEQRAGEPGGNESSNPPYVTRCCCLMLFDPYCSTFTFTLGVTQPTLLTHAGLQRNKMSIQIINMEMSDFVCLSFRIDGSLCISPVSEEQTHTGKGNRLQALIYQAPQRKSVGKSGSIEYVLALTKQLSSPGSYLYCLSCSNLLEQTI